MTGALARLATRRGERRYHYYVTSARVHGEDREVGSLPRIGAPTLDTAVLDRVGPFLRRSWREGEPIEARVRAALRTVTLGASRIGLVVFAAACRPESISGATANGDHVEIAFPISLKHR